MGDVFVRGVVPAEIVVAVGEVDVGFVENGCPLKWYLNQSATVRAVALYAYAVQSLARCAMTVLRSQWLLPTELVFHLAAMALTLPDCLEVRIIVMNFVWFAVLPWSSSRWVDFPAWC